MFDLRNVSIKNISCLILVLNFLFSNQVSGQNQTFSYTQYMDNLTPLNPNYALMDKAGSVNILANKELLGISGGPSTYLFNIGIPINSIGSSAGLVILNEQLAIEKVTEVNGFFAKSIRLANNQFLSVSLNAGIKNYVANYTSLDQSDPSFKQDVRQTSPNIGFGIMLYSDHYYLGLSLPELTITGIGSSTIQNNTNFSKHYFIAGGLLLGIGEEFKFKPAALYSYTVGIPGAADFSGTLYWRGVFGIGADYNTNHQIAGILTLNVDQFHIGYSYRVGTQAVNVSGFGSGTNEIALSYRFGSGATKPRLL